MSTDGLTRLDTSPATSLQGATHRRTCAGPHPQWYPRASAATLLVRVCGSQRRVRWWVGRDAPRPGPGRRYVPEEQGHEAQDRHLAVMLHGVSRSTAHAASSPKATDTSAVSYTGPDLRVGAMMTEARALGEEATRVRLYCHCTAHCTVTVCHCIVTVLSLWRPLGSWDGPDLRWGR